MRLDFFQKFFMAFRLVRLFQTTATAHTFLPYRQLTQLANFKTSINFFAAKLKSLIQPCIFWYCSSVLFTTLYTIKHPSHRVILINQWFFIQVKNLCSSATGRCSRSTSSIIYFQRQKTIFNSPRNG